MNTECVWLQITSCYVTFSSSGSWTHSIVIESTVFCSDSFILSYNYTENTGYCSVLLTWNSSSLHYKGSLSAEVTCKCRDQVRIKRRDTCSATIVLCGAVSLRRGLGREGSPTSSVAHLTAPGIRQASKLGLHTKKTFVPEALVLTWGHGHLVNTSGIPDFFCGRVS